ncbi:MAG TPA: cytochrome c oxidase subunit II [Terriglobales bacterium]|nr:cytochrome c oxidase subunit II [Terriglobales bacterium]
MFQNVPLWPERASTFANNVDALYIFLIAVTGLFTLIVFALVAFFAIKYRQKPGGVATQIEGSYSLEATWTLIPFGLFMVMFVWGASIYMTQVQPPKNAMDIFVVGKQWMWKAQHPEGVREINQLHVPVGRDIKLTLISQDVVHSFYVPEFRIKQDVIPGRYTTMWFHPIKTGRYHLFCAEYCGTEHSGMIGEVVVMEPAEYAAWLSGGSGEGSMASTGQKLFQELGCATCHRSDTQGRGPNLQGAYGKPVLLDTGQTVIADDNYVRESILNPGAKVVSGFKPIMPTFNGIVSEEQLLSLIAYVKSLAQPQQGEPVSNRPAVPGRAPAANAAPKAGNAKVQ